MKRLWYLLACCLAGPLQALQIVDDRGRTVRLTAPPQRIVSLLPSLTETVCALGQCPRLVGVDRYSNHPAEAARLPRMGGGIDPNIEAVVALKPDLVLMAVSARGAERLEALGLTVAALEPQRPADVEQVLMRVGQLLAVPDAAAVWQQIEAGVAVAADSLPPAARKLRVYFEVSRGPYAAGEASFIGDILLRLGVRNIVPAVMGPFPRMNPEFVVRARPDLIMIAASEAPGLAQRPGWDALPALREQRLCTFTPAQADILVRPGPRMAEAARLLAQCIADHSGPARP